MDLHEHIFRNNVQSKRFCTMSMWLSVGNAVNGYVLCCRRGGSREESKQNQTVNQTAVGRRCESRPQDTTLEMVRYRLELVTLWT